MTYNSGVVILESGVDLSGFFKFIRVQFHSYQRVVVFGMTFDYEFFGLEYKSNFSENGKLRNLVQRNR